MTNNTVADYAPTWECGAPPEVVFTSVVMGNDDIFKADALPIDALAIDVAAQAERLTDDPATDRFPLGASSKESASREGM